MIEPGTGIDAIDDDLHGTPLAWAAQEGHTEAVRLLLEHGANPLLPLDRAYTAPTERAKAAGHAEVLAVFAKTGRTAERGL